MHENRLVPPEMLPVDSFLPPFPLLIGASSITREGDGL